MNSKSHNVYYGGATSVIEDMSAVECLGLPCKHATGIGFLRSEGGREGLGRVRGDREDCSVGLGGRRGIVQQSFTACCSPAC